MMKIAVKYNELYNVLKPLEGVRLCGCLSGPPTSKFPLRELLNYVKDEAKELETHKETIIMAVKLNNNKHIICHFNVNEPDDFCICMESQNPWEQLRSIAFRLSKLTQVSYIELLSAITHALYGLITAEEEEVEEITSADQVIEELLTWLPQYLEIID